MIDVLEYADEVAQHLPIAIFPSTELKANKISPWTVLPLRRIMMKKLQNLNPDPPA
jgi:hypothetical protein